MSEDANETRGTAGVIAPPLIYGGALLAGLLAKALLKALFPAGFLPRRFAQALGAPPIGSGLLLFVSSLRAMRREETDVRPNRPTTSLVLHGPYRFTCNPIYLGSRWSTAGLPSSPTRSRPPCCSPSSSSSCNAG